MNGFQALWDGQRVIDPEDPLRDTSGGASVDRTVQTVGLGDLLTRFLTAQCEFGRTYELFSTELLENFNAVLEAEDRSKQVTPQSMVKLMDRGGMRRVTRCATPDQERRLADISVCDSLERDLRFYRRFIRFHSRLLSAEVPMRKTNLFEVKKMFERIFTDRSSDSMVRGKVAVCRRQGRQCRSALSGLRSKTSKTTRTKGRLALFPPSHYQFVLASLKEYVKTWFPFPP